jgi:nucleoside-diphosphate-sugar epimerase
MKVVVTGGGGFLGKAIIKALVKKNINVISFSRSSYPELNKIGVKHIIGDIANFEDVYNALNKEVDAVFHVAAKAGIWGSYESFYNTNVKGTENVLMSCKKLGIKKLIYTSTPSVVYDEKGIEGGNESLPYSKKFLTYYPETKAIAEKMVLQANGKDLYTVALRPHLIWGPGDHHFLPRLISRAKKGKLFLIGSGDYLVDSTYIDNAAESHILAYEKLENNSVINGKAYFITQDQPIKISELINRILDCANLQSVNKFINKDFAYFLAGIVEDFFKFFNIEKEPPLTRFVVKQLSTPHWFDITSAKNELGYVPKISIDEGMNILKNWINNNNINF